jgi:hypothetical protein
MQVLQRLSILPAGAMFLFFARCLLPGWVGIESAATSRILPAIGSVPPCHQNPHIVAPWGNMEFGKLRTWRTGLNAGEFFPMQPGNYSL